MPSMIIGRVSGGSNILSGGYYWSGRPGPVGGIQLVWDSAASGNAYVALSGGVTVTSGGFPASGLSGLGIMDGMQMRPGGAYFIPKLAISLSGNPTIPSIYVDVDATASGAGRMYWEVFGFLLPIGLGMLGWALNAADFFCKG